jgi:hypothetical protein
MIDLFWTLVTEGKGKGLFLKMPVEEGESIFGTHQVALFALINHSCEPTCKLRKSMYLHWVTARHDLAPMTELTIDYNQIPFPCYFLEFDCRCGSPNCRGHIKL